MKVKCKSLCGLNVCDDDIGKKGALAIVKFVPKIKYLWLRRARIVPALKKKQGLCYGKKANDIVQQTGQKIKLEYCPRVKGPNLRGINSLVAHDIGCTIRSLVGMRAMTFYNLDQTEKWKVWNAMSVKTLLGKQAEPWGEDYAPPHEVFSYHLHNGGTQNTGEQLPIIKGFEKTYVKEGDEVTTKHYNDMVDDVNKRNDTFKEQHTDATDEKIMESVQSQQIEVLGTMLKTQKGKEIRGMGRGGELDLSHSSNGSTSRSYPPRADEQQLQEVQERYEQRLKESEERAQQQIQEVKQRALHAESMYSVVQSQVAAIYEHLGMPPPPPQVSPQNNDDRSDFPGLDENVSWHWGFCSTSFIV
ncbi:hypothetical protein ACLB2K_048049 [Fragaria x ananassa]